MLWNGIPRVASILVPWKGIPSSFLFHGMVRSGIPSVCLYLSSTEGKSGLVFLPQIGSEWNSESLILFLFLGTEEIFDHFSPLRNGSERNSESFLSR